MLPFGRKATATGKSSTSTTCKALTQHVRIRPSRHLYSKVKAQSVDLMVQTNAKLNLSSSSAQRVAMDGADAVI